MCTIRRLVVRLLFLYSLIVTVSLSAAETTENRALATALSSITSSELGQHVEVLAGDAFEGREAGSRGGRAAGGYLAEFMSQNGIQPAGDDGNYFQMFGNGYRNVLGMIEGRDPELKHEFILIGAHYDHVGYGARHNSFGPTGYIHNGADDNASGTSGVLEVMQAFDTLSSPPRRSILFAFWDGEEMGLLGSKHFARYPTVPLENIVLMLNSDMIGRLTNQRLEVYGARTASGLRRMVAQQNSDYGLLLDFIWDVNANSDHHPFFEQGIPFLMFHTGLHDNYHRPSDDAELINREGLLAVSQLLFRVAHEVAESAESPAFRNQARFESNHARRQFERTLAPSPPRLGVSWSREDREPGLLVTRVTPGSAAYRAGIVTGDRLLEFAGQPIRDGDHFRMLVLAAASPATAVIQRPDEDEPAELSVDLPGSPVRIGVSWDQDRAERSMVILTRVIPGSAAEHAGLAVHDRVYRIDGQRFVDGDDFGHILSSARGPFRLLVERRGVLREVTVQPLVQPVDRGDSLTIAPPVLAPAN